MTISEIRKLFEDMEVQFHSSDCGGRLDDVIDHTAHSMCGIQNSVNYVSMMDTVIQAKENVDKKLTYEDCCGIAARIWCDKQFSHIVMNTDACLLIAGVLLDVSQGINPPNFTDEKVMEQLGWVRKRPVGREFI